MFIIFFLLMMVPIVVIHELGHFYIGKLTGIAPQVFSIGFGPELWRRVGKDGVIWRVAAIPLGGYVKFADDQNGTSFPNMNVGKPLFLASYRAKIATLLAGPFANFILSIIIFSIYASFYGLQSDGLVIERVHADESMIEKGDLIVSVEGTALTNFEDFVVITQDQGIKVSSVIERDGQKMDAIIWNPNAPIVAGLDPKLPAFNAGIELGDLITNFAGADIKNSSELIKMIAANGEKHASIELLRKGEKLSYNITPIIENDKPRIGVQFGGIYETVHEPLNFKDAVKFATRSTFWIITSSYSGIKDLITGKVSIDAMSGPVGIGKMAQKSAEYGPWSFVFMMGMMSSAIGFLNLIPFPILDGGHVVLITYEKIMGKLPPQKLLNMLFALGFTLLLGLMFYTTIREIFDK